MNIDLTVEITQSLKRYIDREINGIELSRSIKLNSEKAHDLDKNQKRTFGYYIAFFEKENKELYLDSNIYLQEEVNELSEFLSGLAAD